MGKTIFAILLLLLAGCKNFETEKVSTETILQQKLKHFNWNEVDRFPAFENCKEILVKPEMERCFEQTLTSLIYKELAQKKMVLSDSVQAKVILQLRILANGKPEIDSIQIPANLQKQIPNLSNWLQEAIDRLPKIHPATKQGIPVATKFTLPIQVVSE